MSLTAMAVAIGSVAVGTASEVRAAPPIVTAVAAVDEAYGT